MQRPVLLATLGLSWCLAFASAGGEPGYPVSKHEKIAEKDLAKCVQAWWDSKTLKLSLWWDSPNSARWKYPCFACAGNVLLLSYESMQTSGGGDKRYHSGYVEWQFEGVPETIRVVLANPGRPLELLAVPIAKEAPADPERKPIVLAWAWGKHPAAWNWYQARNPQK